MGRLWVEKKGETKLVLITYEHYSTTIVGWVGPGISKMLFETIACLFFLTNNFNLINLGEALSLEIIRMERLTTTKQCCEEAQLIAWISKIKSLDRPINPSQLCLKVAKIIEDKIVTKRIEKNRWMTLFRVINPKLTLRVAQGLEQVRATLCLIDVATFYDNLVNMYMELWIQLYFNMQLIQKTCVSLRSSQ